MHRQQTAFENIVRKGEIAHNEQCVLDGKERTFSIRVENTVGKGEIARYEQFILFPQCFQEDLYCRHVKSRVCLQIGQSYPQTMGPCFF